MENYSAVRGTAPQVLPLGPSHPPTNQRDPEALGKAFESMFVSMVLKQMRKSLDGSMFGGDSSDILGGLFDQFIGSHVAQSGGFGIANMIRHQMERRSERTGLT